MSFYVFDLDGTLADLTHRLHFIQKAPKDWDGFFAACLDDVPIPHTIELLKLLDKGHNHRIEIWSGRSDAVRPETEEWLVKQRISSMRLTRMRRAGDHKPDHELKREFLIDCGRDRPDLIFDDRAAVVRMWRREGIPCFQVADGEF